MSHHFAAKQFAAPCFVLVFLVVTACSSSNPSASGDGANGQCTPSCAAFVCGSDGCGGSCGTCANTETCQGGSCLRADGTCAPQCSGRACGPDGCGGTCGTCASGSCTNGTCGGGDAGAGGTEAGVDSSFDAGPPPPVPTPVNSANVTWGSPCLYNFGSSCPFPITQECGNHQAINVTMPNGPQLLNATLFAGLNCGADALNDNFNDSQRTLGTDLWMFTDDADVAGVSASNPTSAIWWVGPLTDDGLPPAGAPTSECINYTIATPMCD